MALTVIDGLMGSGKSYYVVNQIVADALVNSKRPVVVTANLEIQWDIFIEWLLKRWVGRSIRSSEARKAEFRQSVRDRVTILYNEEREVIDGRTASPLVRCPETGEIRVREEGETLPPAKINMLSEFWYFTKPNSVIVYDEAGDKLNSRKFRATMDTKLQSYINHSRHFKDDLYFIAQSYEDLDKQLREKFHFWINVRNSLKTPIVGERSHAALRFFLGGVFWPTQFFIADTNVREGRKITRTARFRCWPKPEGFKNYNSFSAPADIAGKHVSDDEEATSEDVGASFWRRSRLWLARLPLIIAVLGGVSVVVAFYYMAATGKIFDYLQPDPEMFKSKDTTQSPLTAANSPDGKIAQPGQESPSLPSPAPEKIRMVTRSHVYTDRDVYPLLGVPAELRPALERFQRLRGL